MAYNEIYATKERTGVTYVKYGNVISYGGKTIRQPSKRLENVPAIVVKFPSSRRVGEYGYTEDEIMQIALPFDYVESEIGGVSKDDIVEFGDKSYRVTATTDLSHDPLWGIYILDLRRVKDAS